MPNSRQLGVNSYVYTSKNLNENTNENIATSKTLKSQYNTN